MASASVTDRPFRLVLVEDNTVFRQTIEKLLRQKRPWSIVASVDNGIQALQAIRTEGADVVVLDISLPGMNGFEIAEEIRQLEVRPEIVFLTLHDLNAYRDQARELGAAGFVVKDEFHTRLMPLLDLLASRRRAPKT